MNRIFKTQKPEEVAREIDRKLFKEQRKIDREITQANRQTSKLEMECKQLAKKNQMPAAKVLAMQVIQSRKQTNRLHSTKANINSVQLNMKQQIAMAKVSGALQKSTDVMKIMNRLVKTPQVMQTMRELQKEMMKSGIIEEMMEEGLDEALDNGEDLEAETDEEINKVLNEIISGQLNKVATSSLPATQTEPLADQELTSDDEVNENELHSRLAGLRS